MYETETDPTGGNDLNEEMSSRHSTAKQVLHKQAAEKANQLQSKARGSSTHDETKASKSSSTVSTDGVDNRRRVHLDQMSSLDSGHGILDPFTDKAVSIEGKANAKLAVTKNVKLAMSRSETAKAKFIDHHTEDPVPKSAKILAHRPSGTVHYRSIFGDPFHDNVVRVGDAGAAVPLWNN
jgi:hypothetical protein